MLMHQLLSPERSLWGLQGGSKKRVLELVSQQITQDSPSLDSNTLFSGLLGRERLGSTGIGEGVAIPHCRLADLSKSVGCLVKLETPIDFDSIDGKPVDLLFFLIVPEEATEEHLKTLASAAELFSQEAFRAALRNSSDSSSLYQAVLDRS